MLSGAIGDLLGDLLPAADAKDELQDSFVRYWVEQVMLLKKAGDDFKDTQGGYRFSPTNARAMSSRSWSACCISPSARILAS